MRAAPNTLVTGINLMAVPRPTGELEQLCHEQNGTDHHVPITWRRGPSS